MRISDLQLKDIVNINDGKKIGRIIDVEINTEGLITYFVVEEKRGLSNFLGKETETTITFSQIKKIGSETTTMPIIINSNGTILRIELHCRYIKYARIKINAMLNTFFNTPSLFLLNTPVAAAE